MELLLAPVPLFDRYLSVEAYLLRYRLKKQDTLPAIGRRSPPLEALSSQGIEAFAGERPIFVPVTLAMLEELLLECDLSADRTIFFLEDLSILQKEHLRQMAELRKRGYRFAIIQDGASDDNSALMKLVDYLFFGPGAMENSNRKAHIIGYKRKGRASPAVIATGLTSMEAYNAAKKDGFALFEGMFYRIPVVGADQEMAPLKINLIRLLNLVRDENFEFSEIASIMEQDPALSYSLMRFINSPYLGIRYKVKSIQHAVTILGQIEVRKWVTAAVFKALGSDRPSELVRISLVRAKFAESLAPHFGLEKDAPSLFLMGLFSALDAMLSTTMASAFEKVQVSDEITDALLNRKGRYLPVLDFFLSYERADWEAVEQSLGEYELEEQQVYGHYLDSISWYHELIAETERMRRNTRTRPSMKRKPPAKESGASR